MSPDLRALERDFAEHPDLDHALALSSAYLAYQRLMEAMVVCKKGLRTAPGHPDGLLMLARIYLAQGKLPKAEEIALGLLTHADVIGDACIILGRAALQRGSKAHAAQWFHRGLEHAPEHAGLQSALLQLGPSFAKPPLTTVHTPEYVIVAEPEPTPAPSMVEMPETEHTPEVIPAQEEVSVQTPPLPALPLLNLEEHPPELSITSTVHAYVPPERRVITWQRVALIVVCVLVVSTVVAAYQFLQVRNERQVATSLDTLQKNLKTDRPQDYQDAIAQAERIVSIVPHHVEASAQGAYAAAVLAVDHANKNALSVMTQLMGQILPEVTELPAEYYAAKMIQNFLRGRFDEALALQDPFTEAGKPHPMIELERHRLMKAKGASPQDLDAQKTKLQTLMGDDLRINTYLAWELLEHDNATAEALNHFQTVLKAQPHHVLAKLGEALVRAIQSPTPMLPEERKAIASIADGILQTNIGARSPRAEAIAHFIRGYLADRHGDKATTSQEMALAMPALNNEATFHWLQGFQSVQLGRTRTAARALAEAVKHNVQNPSAWLLLAQAQLDDTSPNAAKASLTQALERGAPMTPQIQLLQGRIHLGNRNFEEAIAALEVIPPQAEPIIRAQAALAIAEALSATKQHLAAASKLSALLHHGTLNIPPHLHAVVWCTLGVEETFSGQSGTAVGSLNRGIEYDPNYALCYFPLCTLNHDKEACATYLRLEPEGPYAKAVSRAMSKAH